MALNRVEYWTDLAVYDMETAEAMYDTKRWLYVGFMCHQVIEKMLKAYWCSHLPSDPPYVHNLARLINGCELDKKMSEEQLSFIDQMTPLNIEARYPEYKEALLKALTPERCNAILSNTKVMMEWIRQML